MELTKYRVNNNNNNNNNNNYKQISGKYVVKENLLPERLCFPTTVKQKGIKARLTNNKFDSCFPRKPK